MAKRQQILIRDLCDLLRTNEDEAPNRLEKVLTWIKDLEKQNEKLQIKQASVNVDELAQQAKEVNGVRWVAAELPGFTPP